MPRLAQALQQRTDQRCRPDFAAHKFKHRHMLLRRLCPEQYHSACQLRHM